MKKFLFLLFYILAKSNYMLLASSGDLRIDYDISQINKFRANFDSEYKAISSLKTKIPFGPKNNLSFYNWDDNNKENEKNKGLELLGLILNNYKNLTLLDINNKKIDENSFSLICDISSLKKLSIIDNKSLGYRLLSFSDYKNLDKLKNLEELDLTSSGFACEDFDYLFKNDENIVFCNFLCYVELLTNLKKLTLDNNSLFPHPKNNNTEYNTWVSNQVESCVKILNDILKKNVLQDLSMQNTELGTIFIENLGNIYKGNKSRTLDFSCNSISICEAANFVTKVNNSSLTVIFTKNGFTHEELKDAIIKLFCETIIEV